MSRGRTRIRIRRKWTWEREIWTSKIKLSRKIRNSLLETTRSRMIRKWMRNLMRRMAMNRLSKPRSQTRRRMRGRVKEEKSRKWRTTIFIWTEAS
jgi:hypothetical protein